MCFFLLTRFLPELILDQGSWRTRRLLKAQSCSVTPQGTHAAGCCGWSTCTTLLLLFSQRRLVYCLIMDGLSAAASGIAVVSIAIQLAESVKKLHDFWSSVKDAPDEVRAFRKDLGLLSTILSKIEREENQYGTSPETLEVLENCKEQVASLTALVRNISPGFEAASRRARKWSALKAAFKKDKRLEFRDCLRETKITLILARQSSRSVSS